MLTQLQTSNFGFLVALAAFVLSARAIYVQEFRNLVDVVFNPIKWENEPDDNIHHFSSRRYDLTVSNAGDVQVIISKVCFEHIMEDHEIGSRDLPVMLKPGDIRQITVSARRDLLPDFKSMKFHIDAATGRNYTAYYHYADQDREFRVFGLYI